MTIKQLLNLQGKKAVVTGGSRGLGLQIAEGLCEMGAEVLISARKANELDTTAEQLRGQGHQVQTIAADTATEGGVRHLAHAAIELLGQVDILVNNAGTSWAAPAEEHPLEAWDKVMNLNVRSVFLLTQILGRESMIPRRYGRIVNVASIAGLRGNPPGAMKTLAYNASKGAVVNFTRALAGEWAPYGITVNAIAPGFFPSRMTQGAISQYGEDTLAGLCPLNRLGGPEDLKGAALLFASDAGQHITGQILAVDGGLTAV